MVVQVTPYGILYGMRQQLQKRKWIVKNNIKTE